jgi:hypothetical protein
MQNSPCGTPQAHGSDLAPVKLPQGFLLGYALWLFVTRLTATVIPSGLSPFLTGISDKPKGINLEENNANIIMAKGVLTVKITVCPIVLN